MRPFVKISDGMSGLKLWGNVCFNPIAPSLMQHLTASQPKPGLRALCWLSRCDGGGQSLSKARCILYGGAGGDGDGAARATGSSTTARSKPH